MKTTLLVVTIALLLSLAGNWYFWNQSDKLSNLEQQSQEKDWERVKYIQQLRARAATSAARISELEDKRIRDSLLFKSRETALKIDLERSKASARKLRPTVQAKIDSFPDLRAFVGAQDSVIQQQDSLIHDMEQHHIGQVLDLQAIIKEKTSQIMAQIAVSETLGQVVTNLETENNILKRKVKKKFSVGPYAGYGVSREGLSPSLGISVQYSLFRF